MFNGKRLLDYTNLLLSNKYGGICLDFNLRKIDEIVNCFIKETKKGNSMSKMHKDICMDLRYIEQQLILVSAVTGCVSISTFALLVGIPVYIASSVVGLKIKTITAWIKNITQ